MRDVPAAGAAEGSTVATATPLRELLRSAGFDKACTPQPVCASDARALEAAIDTIRARYIVPPQSSSLARAATGAVAEAVAARQSTASDKLLGLALDAVVASLDTRSRYWILRADGSALTEGPKGIPAEDRHPNPQEATRVQWRLLGGGIGYTAVGRFGPQTEKQLRKAIDELEKAHGANLKGLVLDLRNSSGGLLGVGASVAGMFLAGGIIAHTRGPSPEAQLRFEANGQDVLRGAPLAILVNELTASTAELVAGSLQDRGRALVFGTPSFGKGTVQTMFLIHCRIVLSLTTARYLLPSGRWIGDGGVRPDFWLANDEHAVKIDQPGGLPGPADGRRRSPRPVCSGRRFARDAALECAADVLTRLTTSG